MAADRSDDRRLRQTSERASIRGFAMGKTASSTAKGIWQIPGEFSPTALEVLAKAWLLCDCPQGTIGSPGTGRERCGPSTTASRGIRSMGACPSACFAENRMSVPSTTLIRYFFASVKVLSKPARIACAFRASTEPGA